MSEASWKVPPGGQRQTTKIVAGHVIDGVEITFVLASGSYGNVFLPTAGFTEDAARAAIQTRADAMAALETS